MSRLAIQRGRRRGWSYLVYATYIEEVSTGRQYVGADQGATQAIRRE